MPVLRFGYKCQECGQGTVHEKVFHEYQTKLKGLPFTVDDARIGVCDQCGARHFDPNETVRWRNLLDQKYAESYLQPSDIQDVIKRLGLSMEQFATLLGCTRQSLYNWQRPDRSAPQSRMADLFMRLVRESHGAGQINVLSFLTAEANKLGFSLSISPKSKSTADIIAFARKVPANSVGKKEVPASLKLAADSDALEEAVVLVTGGEEAIARLRYRYQDATLRVEFINDVPFVEFDAEIFFKDGRQAKSNDVEIRDREAVLVNRTECSEDAVDRVVLSPKELLPTMNK